MNLARSGQGVGHQGKGVVFRFDGPTIFRPIFEPKRLTVDVRLLGKQLLVPGIEVRPGGRNTIGILGPNPWS